MKMALEEAKLIWPGPVVLQTSVAGASQLCSTGSSLKLASVAELTRDQSQMVPEALAEMLGLNSISP